MLLGLTRMLLPTLWDRLIEIGFIQINGPVAEFLDHLSSSDQGFLIILFAALFLASGWGMVMLGKYLLRGLRFLFSLTFERMRRFAQSIRRKLRQNPFPSREGNGAAPAFSTKGG
jgi:hypothetical protein